MLWEEELEAKRIQDDEDRKRKVTLLDPTVVCVDAPLPLINGRFSRTQLESAVFPTDDVYCAMHASSVVNQVRLLYMFFLV